MVSIKVIRYIKNKQVNYSKSTQSRYLSEKGRTLGGSSAHYPSSRKKKSNMALIFFSYVHGLNMEPIPF